MINGQTLLYGIIGKPVRHTLSPVIHNRAFKRLGWNAAYLAFEVDHLESAVRGIRGLGVRGVSVTIPFKVDIIPHLDRIDAMAERIKAVNTISNRMGKLIGYNTDWSGAMAALEERIEMTGNRVCLLGAGGAARAIGFGLKKRRCSVMLFNRSADAGARLAGELGFDYRPWSSLLRKNSLDADVLINATSAGMSPHDETSPVPKRLLQKGMTVMDIVYRPLRTLLLREAEEQGCDTIDGLEMLAQQGAGQLEIWTGKKMDIRVIRKDLRQFFKNEIEGRG